MSEGELDLSTSPQEIAHTLRQKGVSGAGGGGFPTYVKWDSLRECDYLLVNHQESEPNCYIDKWVGYEYSTELADLFDELVSTHLDTVVVSAKRKQRERWLQPLENATDARVYLPEELPVDPTVDADVVVAYTDDTYELGMENVLLQQVADVVIGKDLPVDYGWIVQNTETMYNVWRALALGEPVLEKLVHVDGYRADGSRIPHDLFRAPVGTSAAALLDAAGVDPDTLGSDRTLVEGGPGWCFKVQRPADRYGVTKHTNCLALLDEAVIAENTYGNGRINVLDALSWDVDTTVSGPTTVDPDRVHVPTVTNEEYNELITESAPLVEFGDQISDGQMVAQPRDDTSGFNIAHHTPIAGEVSDITPREIEVRRS